MIYSDIPLVSIVIPTHNRENRVSQAIESILQQTVEDFEVIVVADACKDQTVPRVSRMKDSRVRLIQTHEQVGGGQARNIGIDHAKGKYLAFLDDDDTWLSDKLEQQLEVMQNPNISLVTCNHCNVNGEAKKVIVLPSQFDLKDILYQNVAGSFSFVMMRRSDLGQLRIDPKLTSCQDWDLWVKLLAKTGRYGISVQEPLAHYHIHKDGRISDYSSKKICGFITFLKNHWDKLSEAQQNFNKHSLILEILRTYKLSLKERIKMVIKAFLFLNKSGVEFRFHRIKMTIGKLLWMGKIQRGENFNSYINFILNK